MNMKRFLIPIVILLLVVAIGATYMVVAKNNAVSNKTTREVALSCTIDEETKFHIHPNLQIIINGKPQVIPAEIGVTSTCLSSIHTHDATGVIHIESPEKRDFTLGDFFAVWKKTFNKNQLMDYKTDDQHIIKETINGKESQDFENTVLHDGDQIVLSYEAKK